MTKKIRLTDEIDEVATALTPEVGLPAAVDTATVKQLMKFIEAIDWKLWEMLKIMKINDGNPIEPKEEDTNA